MSSPLPEFEHHAQQSAALFRRVSYPIQVVLFAASYFVVAKFSLLLAIPPGYATAVWPPSGLALAAVLLLGGRSWPGIWLGAALVNFTINASYVAALTIGIGNTLEALAGAALIRRFVGVPFRFERGEDVVVFVALSALSATVAASIALIPLSFGHSLSGAEILWNWCTWWLGDASGIIIVTPLVLSWCARENFAWSGQRALEGICLAVLLGAAVATVFGHVARFPAQVLGAWVILPFIIWAAFRFSQREVATAIAAVCAFAVWNTVAGKGPFVSDSTNQSLLALLAFVCTVVAIGLVLSAVLGERGRAMEQLRRRHDELESGVRQRTAELERVNQALQEAKAVAEKANRAKSGFLTNVSHELRTPLNSVLILANLLVDNKGENLTPRQVQYAQTIHDAGMDLIALIDDILDLAKIESGAVITPTVERVRFAEVQDYLERTFRQVALNKGLQFVISIDPRLPPAMETDEKRLRQILKNLLSNSFKFTSRGSVSLDIAPAATGWTPGHPQLEAAGEIVGFSVTDTGIGIPADKQQIVFEPFHQADEATGRKYGGTGLGLSISREWTRLLGGEIRLASSLGQGSTFTLYLPLGGNNPDNARPPEHPAGGL